jgi:hypothetical protein
MIGQYLAAQTQLECGCRMVWREGTEGIDGICHVRDCIIGRHGRRNSIVVASRYRITMNIIGCIRNSFRLQSTMRSRYLLLGEASSLLRKESYLYTKTSFISQISEVLRGHGGVLGRENRSRRYTSTDRGGTSDRLP